MKNKMSIVIEEEVKIPFLFPYKEIIEKVINYSLDYVQCPYEAEINVILTNNENIQQINKEYREIDQPTDVLSFPLVDYQIPGDFNHVEDSIEEYFNPETGELLLGDIIISVEKTISQSEEFGHTVQRELAFLIAHSMLHLFGYDHMEETERIHMEKLQNELLNNLEITR